MRRAVLISSLLLMACGPQEWIGVQDPMRPETRAKARPRACAMGGEAMAVWDLETSASSPTAHTEVDYAVVGKAQPGTP